MGKSNEIFVTTVLIKEDFFLSILLSDQNEFCLLLKEVERGWGSGAEMGQATGPTLHRAGVADQS